MLCDSTTCSKKECYDKFASRIKGFQSEEEAIDYVKNHTTEVTATVVFDESTFPSDYTSGDAIDIRYTIRMNQTTVPDGKYAKGQVFYRNTVCL